MTFFNQMLPQFIDINVGSKNRRNRKNSLELHRRLVAFLEKSSDPNSLYHQLLKEGGMTLDDILNDLKGVLMAGFDTTSRGTIAALYQLVKHPKVMAELKSQLREKVKVMDTESVMKAVQEIELLTNVVKESLRLDPPTINSITY